MNQFLTCSSGRNSSRQRRQFELSASARLLALVFQVCPGPLSQVQITPQRRRLRTWQPILNPSKRLRMRLKLRLVPRLTLPMAMSLERSTHTFVLNARAMAIVVSGGRRPRDRLVRQSAGTCVARREHPRRPADRHRLAGSQRALQGLRRPPHQVG